MNPTTVGGKPKLGRLLVGAAFPGHVGSLAKSCTNDGNTQSASRISNLNTIPPEFSQYKDPDGGTPPKSVANCPCQRCADACVLQFDDVTLYTIRTGTRVGLIWSSIGGSPDEVWMPPSAFAACEYRRAAGWLVAPHPLPPLLTLTPSSCAYSTRSDLC